jgi:DNA-binding protein H-NS
MTAYKELLARKAELDAQIAQAHAEHKAEGIAAARALIQEHSLTAADVFPAAKPKGSVGAPKYRDPRHRGDLDRPGQAAELDRGQGPHSLPDHTRLTEA